MKALAALLGAVAIGFGWSGDHPSSKGPPPCREAAFVSAKTGKVLRELSTRDSSVGPGYDTGPLLPGSDAVPDGKGAWFIAGYGIARMRNDGRLVKSWHAQLSARRRYSGLTLAGGKLYVMDASHVYALSARTGMRLWRSPRIYRLAALAVSPTAVYVGGYFHRVGGVPRSELAALDARTGRLLPWHGPRLGYYKNSSPVVTGLAVSSTRLYLVGSFLKVGGVEQSSVAALRLRDGSLALFRPKQAIWNVAALAVSGRRVLIGGPEGGGIFDARTSARLPGSKAAQQASAFLVHGSTVYLGGGGKETIEPYNLEALDLRTGALKTWFPKLAPVVWSAAVMGVVRGKVFVAGQFCKTTAT
jgi:hypothetical protein